MQLKGRTQPWQLLQLLLASAHLARQPDTTSRDRHLLFNFRFRSTASFPDFLTVKTEPEAERVPATTRSPCRCTQSLHLRQLPQQQPLCTCKDSLPQLSPTETETASRCFLRPRTPTISILPEDLFTSSELWLRSFPTLLRPKPSFRPQQLFNKRTRLRQPITTRR